MSVYGSAQKEEVRSVRLSHYASSSLEEEQEYYDTQRKSAKPIKRALPPTSILSGRGEP